MKFKEHGEFTLKIDNKLLIIEGTGPFNKEMVAQYKTELEANIETLENASWNQLVILHQMSIFTPDAEKALIHSLVDRHSRGLFACAVLINEESYKNMVMEQMSRCYTKAGVEHEYFTSATEAKNWLASLNNPALIATIKPTVTLL